ncbi:IS5 family transposase [Deinococcus irradiatisoli]|uniref:IS5 family transposase n=1 Tax=Deinococcus irradiatisoli TaxID=2202254 RepID=A0A2Z3JHG0_9DEIO|nr:IS5 family transposase [Deinococcus irradiatisoli]AWN22810.1 IS5 family transposase [Deinococcus irradiatisoli]
MSYRTDLTDAQWHALRPHLPANPKRGRPFAEHRRVINGILWRIKLGAPWRDIPERYGPWRTCHDRLSRWERDNTWLRILQVLQGVADRQGQINWEGASIDSTHLRAHRSAVGARKQSLQNDSRAVIAGEWLGHSRGGRTTKLHLCADGNARPLSVVLSEGQRADGPFLLPVLKAIRVPRAAKGRPRSRPPVIRVDRAYGARVYRRLVQARGIRFVCPEREDAKRYRREKGTHGGRPPAFDPEAYKGRNVVERAVNRLKDFRAIATRYEKRGRNFMAVVLVACLVLWL